MRTANILSPIIFLICIITACDDFIEPDIENKTISIIAPPDSFRSSILSQTFWWNELDGAETYQLQIVKGNFSYIQEFILDTSVATAKFQYSLQPGMYQWRVRGENNGGNTSYSTRTFTIDSTLDLSSQTVVLVSPQNNYVTGSTMISFQWQSLYNADEYNLQIIDTASGATIKNITQTSTQHIDTLSEGTYEWKVRALNSTSITPYTTWKIIIDLSGPSAPTLVSPLNNAIIIAGSNDSLTWLVDQTSVSDSLYIDTDSIFSNPNKIFSITTYYLITQSTGTYFWKVKSMDGAGNQSAFSAYRKFYIQ